jgi:predicted nucleic acid-binding protein
VSLGLDTSVTLRLLLGEPAAQAEAARRLLVERGARTPLLLSDLVVGESYFALRHHYHVPHVRAVAALRALLSDPHVYPNGVARRVLETVPEAERGAGFMDRLIHGDYGENDAALVTFDRHAARLEGALLLD